jgi:hypothetical protein
LGLALLLRWMALEWLLFPTPPLLKGFETTDRHEMINTIATFFMIFGAQMDILFAIKVKILVLINIMFSLGPIVFLLIGSNKSLPLIGDVRPFPKSTISICDGFFILLTVASLDVMYYSFAHSLCCVRNGTPIYQDGNSPTA